MAVIGLGVTFAVGLAGAEQAMGQVGVGSSPLSILVLLATFGGLCFGQFLPPCAGCINGLLPAVRSV